MATSSVRLLRLPVHVHRACGSKAQCTENCSCMSEPAWKPVRAAAWDGLCEYGCMEWETATVALVDSGATHCFVSATLVAKFELPV